MNTHWLIEAWRASYQSHRQRQQLLQQARSMGFTHASCQQGWICASNSADGGYDLAASVRAQYQSLQLLVLWQQPQQWCCIAWDGPELIVAQRLPLSLQGVERLQLLLDGLALRDGFKPQAVICSRAEALPIESRLVAFCSNIEHVAAPSWLALRASQVRPLHYWLSGRRRLLLALVVLASCALIGAYSWPAPTPMLHPPSVVQASLPDWPGMGADSLLPIRELLTQLPLLAGWQWQQLTMQPGSHAATEELSIQLQLRLQRSYGELTELQQGLGTGWQLQQQAQGVLATRSLTLLKGELPTSAGLPDAAQHLRAVLAAEFPQWQWQAQTQGEIDGVPWQQFEVHLDSWHFSELSALQAQLQQLPIRLMQLTLNTQPQPIVMLQLRLFEWTPAQRAAHHSANSEERP